MITLEEIFILLMLLLGAHYAAVMLQEVLLWEE